MRAGMAVAGLWTVLSDEELVICGATHLVQMVLVLVLKMVDMLVVSSMEVTPPETLVLVTGQLVTVV